MLRWPCLGVLILFAAGIHAQSTLPDLEGKFAFTDSAGRELPPGAAWSPAAGKLYLTYSDDSVPNLDVQVSITVVNRKGKVGADAETIVMKNPVVEGGKGVWRAVVPLDETPAPLKNDGIVQTYVMGDLTAVVKSHDATGAPNAKEVTAKLLVAYPDRAESIQIENAADPKAPVDRNTQSLIIQVVDQDNYKLQDTVYARIACGGSNDYIYSFPLFQTAPGILRSAPIPKAEGAAKTDAVLQCLETDNLTVTYTDEVYGTKIEASVSWMPNGVASFTYRDAADTSIVIDSVSDKYATTFTIVAKIPNPTANVIDTVVVNLLPDDIYHDNLNVTLVETGPNTGVFMPRAPIHFEFIDTLPPDLFTRNDKLEVWWSPTVPYNASIVTGKVSLLGGKIILKSDIKLVSGYFPVQTAYIKDLDEDGAGDHVYLVFPQKVDRLPATLSPVFWNQEGPAFENAKPPIISFEPASDQTIIVADFSASPFPAGLTGIAPYAKPFATLPKDALFKGQKPILKDSIRPVLISADAFPFDPGLPGKNQPPPAPDTLRVVVSEPLSAADWSGLFRFAKPSAPNACPAYDSSIAESLVPQIAADSVHINFLMPRSANPPVKGDCIYYNVDGTVTDKVLLLPSKRPLVIGGKSPRKYATAYIKDVDGDGSGDHVYLSFNQDLDQLPASITPVYWNAEGGEFADRQAPILSFAPGSRRLVIADFSGAPFNAGLTGIADGAFPHATLPDEGGLPGLLPFLQDSIGPMPIKADLVPIDPIVLFQNKPVLDADTLRVVFSEPLNDARLDGLLRFATMNPDSSCPDYAQSQPVASAAPPKAEADGVTYVLLLDPAVKSVHAGGCVYLTADGTITDKPGNTALKKGVRVTALAQRPLVFRGYPPVAGGDAAWLVYPIISTDPTAGAGDGFTRKNPGFTIPWIPPVFFNRERPYDLKPLPQPGAPAAGTDTRVTEELPKGVSTVEVVSTGRYQAQVAIYDNLGNFIRSFHQTFGYDGELQNPVHHTNLGFVSFLAWDMTDRRRQHAGQGVYIWKMIFTFDDGTRSAFSLRTGALRNP